MRLFLTFVLFSLSIIQSVNACSCVLVDICQRIESFTDEETDLIFMGSFIKSEVIEGIYSAWQFRVIKVYNGEIITPNSVHYTGETYTNTDSTVWIISSGGNLCTSRIDNHTAIFTVSYNNPQGVGLSAENGYAPLICSPDYYPISSNNTVEGYISSGDLDRDTVTVDELEELIFDCVKSSLSNVDDYVQENVVIHPQPTTGKLFVSSDFDLLDWEVKLFDMSGKEIVKLESNQIDISGLNRGVYFLQFVKDRKRFTKKIIKI